MTSLKTKALSGMVWSGIEREVTVVAPGINSKMDEVRAAYGLLNLKLVAKAIARRKEIARQYREVLSTIPGIRYMDDMPGVAHNYSYFPIFIDEEVVGISRDDLYFRMREEGVFGRRYFYPLISDFIDYKGLPSSDPVNLPVANKIADSVICLPIYADLDDKKLKRVLNTLLKQLPVKD